MRGQARAALITFFVILVLGSAIGFTLPRRFVASTDLWLDRDRGLDPDEAQGTGPPTLARNTELRLLTSRELATRTVAALGLERVRGLGQPRDGSLLKLQDAQRRATQAVQAGLSVESLDEAYAVRIRFRADRPEIAASVVNRLADLYVEDRSATSTRALRQQRLAAAVISAREAVLRSESALATYRSAASVLDRYGGSADPQEDLAALDEELADARAAARAAQGRAERASATIEPILRGLERRRSQRLVEGSLGNEAVDRQFADQKRRLDGFTTEARSASARVRLLTRMRERSARLAVDSRRVDAELGRLMQAAAASRSRYADAAAAVAQNAAGAVDRDSTAYVVSRSSAESARRRPTDGIVLLASLVLAAIASMLVALVLELRHKGFRTATALQRALGTRVLAVVPTLTDSRRVATGEDRLFVPDFLAQAPESEFARIFQDLLRSLREGRAQVPLVIAVSSALPDEGKTTVSLCLARTAALSGARTVLVDCDLRRPAASRSLFPTLDRGLMEAIEGGASLADVLLRDPGSGAMVLGIGSKRAARSTSLDPKSVARVLQELKQGHDLIVCDLPPALALSEARETAALADVVLLVVRQRQTPAGAVTIAQDLLKRAGAKVGGAALTMVRT